MQEAKDKKDIRIPACHNLHLARLPLTLAKKGKIFTQVILLITKYFVLLQICKRRNEN